MKWTPPTTPDGWESKLIDYLLRFGIDGDAQDIRWLEVTPSTLAAAFTDSGTSAGEIEKASQACTSRIPDLPLRLESGMMERSNDKSPGHFTYLVMTLLISSQFDIPGESNGFRLRLRSWLQTGHSYQNLAGVNAMREALAGRLEQRIQKEESYRRLILPEIPSSWSYIGYTLRLAFPGKTDLRLVTRVLMNHQQAVSSPRLLIDYFQFAIQKENTSYAMSQAFNEFKDAWFAGRRTFADMPFQRLHQRATTQTSDVEMRRAIIDMRVDFDDSRCYFSSSDENNDSVFTPSLSEALISTSAGHSENLGKAVQIGLIFFHQVGHGRWRAIAVLDKRSLQFYVVLSCKHSMRISKYLDDAVIEGNWILTRRPQSHHLAMDMFRVMKASSDSPDEQITRPLIYDGIRVPGGWLGSPAFLPFIKSDARNYRVYALGKNRVKIDVKRIDGQLISFTLLDDGFIIEPELEADKKMPLQRWRVRFFDRAVPHPALGESARYHLERLTERKISQLKTPVFCANAPLSMEGGDVRCEHLLEATYATGASGWEEVELVPPLQRVVDGINIWHLLCCLHDAGLIEPRLRQSWKGRVRTLVKPSLFHIRYGKSNLVIVEGAICSRLIGDFQKAVSELGEKYFRCDGVSVWSPPVFGAEIDDLVALSRIIEWPLVEAPSKSNMMSLAFMSTLRTAELHVQAATRDWNSGHFLPHVDLDGETTRLTCHVHPGGRDRDVYRVVTHRKTEFFLSRTAAIIAANVDAHRPTFRKIVDNRLICITNDCGLPNALATGLRRNLLRDGGPTEAGYAYPLDDISFRWLNQLLPGCFYSLLSDDNNSVSRLVSAVRHSGGKMRLQWRNGLLALWTGK